MRLESHYMVTSETTTNPKGIFDRSTKGMQLPPIAAEIERGRIRFFAEVLGETNPVHFDLAAARDAGFPDLVAPPSFFMVIEACANEERHRLGQPSTAAFVKCDYRYLLHGDEKYEYRGLIFAGDSVILKTKVVDFYDKKGGAMEFVTIESTLEHAERGLVVRATRTLLHRLY
jgi:acyl dehydratase